MTDRISEVQRSNNMARVKNKNTAPELLVRKTLHRLGFRFRIHRKDLPGNPDIVLPRYKTAIFVHGCFWHGHDCPRGKRPATHKEFWDTKLDTNIQRDRENQERLKEKGWRVLVIWECETKDNQSLQKRIATMLHQSNS